MKPRFTDWRLYLVTERSLMGGRDPRQVIQAAVRGGVTVVQLREKELSTRAFIELAEQLLLLLRPLGVPLIINDRVDVALASGADGVHLGQSDMRVEQARALLGPERLLGLSLENIAHLQTPEVALVDYVAASPVFATPTKTDTAPPWGIEGLRALCRLSPRPVVAIGGIHAGNAAALREAGAAGLAVVSALCAAPDPEAAARALCPGAG